MNLNFRSWEVKALTFDGIIRAAFLFRILNVLILTAYLFFWLPN